MFSPVSHTKLRIANVLVLAALSVLLLFMAIRGIRQVAGEVLAAYGGAAADGIFHRLQERHAGQGPFTEKPSGGDGSVSLLSGIDVPGRGMLCLVDERQRAVAYLPDDQEEACVREILTAFFGAGAPDSAAGGADAMIFETGAGACPQHPRRWMAWCRPLGEGGLWALFLLDADPAARFAGFGIRRLLWAAVILLACALLLLAASRPWGRREGGIEARSGPGGDAPGPEPDGGYAPEEPVKDAAELLSINRSLSMENHALKQRLALIREHQDSLRRSEERYRTMLENIEEYFYEADLSGNLLFFNDALYRMLGYAREKLIGMNFRELMDRGTAEKAFRTFRKAYETGQAQKGIGWRLVRRDGSECHIEISVSLIRNLEGEVIGFRGVARNVSELIYLVYHDSLTGLYNRKAFFERMRETLAIAKRDQKKKNIFYLDLDEFKRVNDEYGHHIGDGVLVEVAARLKASLRETDHICRIGGDEFVVILNNLKDQSHPEEAAQRVLMALSRPYRIQGHHIDFITPSIGISTYPTDSDNVEILIRCADIAMFKAKRKDGGGCYAFYHKAMDAEWRTPEDRKE